MTQIRCLLLVCLTSPVAFCQKTQPANPKPQREPIAVKPAVADPVLQQQETIDFKLIAQQVLSQKKPVDRFQIRPQVRVEPVQPELVLGWRPPVVNLRFTSEKDFKTFIDEQIAALRTRFKLRDTALRRLQLVAKGVVHRSKAQKAAPKKRAPDEPFILVLGIEPMRELSGEFRDRLSKNKLWNTTLAKVLTKAQQEEWAKVVSVPPQTSTDPKLPRVIVDLGENVKK